MFTKKYLHLFILIIAGLLVFLTISGCSENAPQVNSPLTQNTNSSTQLNKSGGEYKENAFQQFNLVSDVTGFSAARTDENLVNAWGIAVSPTGRFWISANHTGLSVVYDNAGNQKLGPVTIPTVNNASGGAPTGVVYNFTQKFKVPNTDQPSKFIFVGEDGIVSAWAPTSGSSAVVAADQSSQNAVYKGCDIAIYKGQVFLYAANFKQARVDVFDKDFKLVTKMSFIDDNIPAGFAPFNIKTIHNKLFITYAKQKGPDNMDDQKGPGNGFVNVFTPGGKLITRFASQGCLNSPWGVTLTPHAFHKKSAQLLIGNFGDGRINMFNADGKFLGQLLDTTGNPITIEGLWGLHSINEEMTENDKSLADALDRIYFTAGPNEESHGLFGYLKSK